MDILSNTIKIRSATKIFPTYSSVFFYSLRDLCAIRVILISSLLLCEYFNKSLMLCSNLALGGTITCIFVHILFHNNLLTIYIQGLLCLGLQLGIERPRKRHIARNIASLRGGRKPRKKYLK